MACLFCDFLKTKKNHINNFPFLLIFETQESVSFLSIPTEKQPSHVLVIPKNHYEFIEDLPKHTLYDLISHVTLASKIVKKFSSACRIQLNNGIEAEQYIPHVHFHILSMKDKKEVPLPNLKEFNLENFKKTTEMLKKEFEKLQFCI